MHDVDLSQAWFEVVSGGQPGQKLPLASANTTFGRVAGNTHVVDDATISRQHAKVFLRDGRHWIADQNSSHGTFVNGTKITLQTLADGDEVRLGKTVLRYKLDAAPAASAAPTLFPADARTGSFDLELAEPDGPPATLPRSAAPPAAPSHSASSHSPSSHPPPKSLPPSQRSSLTPEGEDPFAEEEAKVRARAAAAAMPEIELRGETARHLGARTSGQPVPAASGRSATAHIPPPIAKPPRTRGPFAFLRDELDQRGTAARFTAALLAIAAAGALFWLTMKAFDAAPKSDGATDTEEQEHSGPPGPVLPPRR